MLLRRLHCRGCCSGRCAKICTCIHCRVCTLAFALADFGLVLICIWTTGWCYHFKCHCVQRNVSWLWTFSGDNSDKIWKKRKLNRLDNINKIRWCQSVILSKAVKNTAKVCLIYIHVHNIMSVDSFVFSARCFNLYVYLSSV